MIPAVSITIELDAEKLIGGMTDLMREQVPYATSRAVNDVALMIQQGEREAMKQNFNIRRQWVLDGVRIIQFSNKGQDPITAILDIAPDRSFLNKFEEGGMKTPRGANIAMPTDTVRPSPADVVASALRPKSFGLSGTGKGDRRTFIIGSGPGAGIWQRTGPGPRDIRMLWSFKQSARIGAMLGFRTTARQQAERWWDARFAARFDEAMASAR